MIEKNLVYLALKQISQIYTTIKISNVKKFVSFLPEYDTD